MNVGNCPKCGTYSKAPDNCWKCRQTAMRDEAYALGYQTGFLKGQSESPLQLTRERWRQLTQLCHPDKHGGSAISTDVAVWLSSLKPE